MKPVIALALTAIFATTGCKNDVSAIVDCRVAEGPTVNCSIHQTRGTAEIEVCWDFKATCASGATLEAVRTCGSVKDSQTTKTTISADSIKVTGECDAVKETVVTNLSWSAK